MKIDLSIMQQRELAEYFAREVYRVVLARNLDLVSDRAPVWREQCRTAINWMRAAIMSIESKLERRCFCSAIKYEFTRICALSGLEIRGRDYVAAVRAFRENQKQAA
jgi:hypothetical protein